LTTSTTALVAPLSTTLADAGAPVTDEQVREAIAAFDNEQATLARRGVILQEERVDSARKAIAGLDIADMAPSQIAILSASEIFALMDLTAPAIDRLSAFLDRQDAEGAAARVLHLYLRAETGKIAPDENIIDLLRKVLTDPALPEAVRKGWAPRVFLAIGVIDAKGAATLADELFGLERILTEDLPIRSRPEMYTYFVALRSIVVNDASRAQDLERIRVRMIGLLNTAQRDLPTGEQWYATRIIRVLSSDWAKNVAFPGPSPP